VARAAGFLSSPARERSVPGPRSDEHKDVIADLLRDDHEARATLILDHPAGRATLPDIAILECEGLTVGVVGAPRQRLHLSVGVRGYCTTPGAVRRVRATTT
jgi:hypothetical protein